MKWKRLLSIFFLLGTQVALSQPTEFREKPRKVKMPKYFVTEIPKKSLPFSSIQVIQAVWDSSRLGYIQKGLANIKAEALPNKDLTAFLQNYVDHQYEESYKKTGSQLLIVVKELRINERTFFSSEYAFTKIKADAWISPDGLLYKKAAGMDTVLTYSNMADVTIAHGENIARGFYQLVLATLKNAAEGNFKSPDALAPADINRREREKFNIPILKATSFKEGAYMSFQEFLNNEPSVISFDFSVIDQKKGKVQIVKPDSKSQIAPWGICKGGEIYKYYEQELVPIEKNNDGFIISDYLEKSHRRNGGIFLGSLLGVPFGLAGGLAATGIASSAATKLYSVTNIPYIIKKQPEACAIDMQTGEFTF